MSPINRGIVFMNRDNSPRTIVPDKSKKYNNRDCLFILQFLPSKIQCFYLIKTGNSLIVSKITVSTFGLCVSRKAKRVGII